MSKIGTFHFLRNLGDLDTVQLIRGAGKAPFLFYALKEGRIRAVVLNWSDFTPQGTLLISRDIFYC